MAVQDDILNFVQLNGPVLPTHVVQKFKLNTMFAGAYLSELTAGKKIRVSNLKVGTSPVYYTPGQEARLQNYIKYLEEKEQEAVTELQTGKVLQDNKLDVVKRVALRNTKDFAVPLRVNLKTGPEIFWKWYLTSNDEASNIIRKALNILTEDEKALVRQQEEEQKRREEELLKEQEQKRQQLEQDLKKTQEETRAQVEIVLRKEMENEYIPKKEWNKLKKEHEAIVKQLEQMKSAPQQEPMAISAETQLKLTLSHKNMRQDSDSFAKTLVEYFDRFNISVIHYTIVRPDMEIDATVSLPTVLGQTTYYCKAQNKKRIGEGDLSSALLQSHQANLPALFVSPGTLTKKTQELLSKQFKSMIVKKL